MGKEISWEREISCGAIIFFLKEERPIYLLLKYKNYWGFVKGHSESGESSEITARRETKEEANISNLELIHGFREEIGYFFKFEGKTKNKTVIFLLGKITEEESKKVKVSFEHEDFKFCGYEEAQGMLKFKNELEVLKKADKFISS